MAEPACQTTPVVLFASNNSAKVEEARKFFGQVNINVVSPSGTRVRRWVGHKMTDDEIISHCISRMESFHLPEQRRAVMRTSVCVKFPDSDAQMFFTGELHGEILRIPDPLIKIEGFPMERIFYVTEWSKLLGEVAIMEASEKSKYPTHREKVLLMVLEEIQQRYNLK